MICIYLNQNDNNKTFGTGKGFDPRCNICTFLSLANNEITTAQQDTRDVSMHNVHGITTIQNNDSHPDQNHSYNDQSI